MDDNDVSEEDRAYVKRKLEEAEQEKREQRERDDARKIKRAESRAATRAEQRASLVDLLDKTHAMAIAGEITDILIICVHKDENGERNVTQSLVAEYHQLVNMLDGLESATEHLQEALKERHHAFAEDMLKSLVKALKKLSEKE